MRLRLPFAILLALGALGATPSPLALSPSDRAAILDRTAELRLAPDRSDLSTDQRETVALLLRAGGILQHLYELENHRQAPEVRRRIAGLARGRGGRDEARGLADVYRLFRGPIATRLDNERVPLLPGVDPQMPGRNVYPWGIQKAELDRWLEAHPDQREAILDTRTVVRRTTDASLRADLALLARHPGLALLHPSLEGRLRARLRASGRSGFYAIPYALAWADSLARVSELLHAAAERIERTDAEFAGYLRLRARDLLANDYEGGDAAWVTGTFGRLNLQLGAYETYDDELYGVKAFHSASLLLRDPKASDALRAAIRGLQQFEDALPYTPHKKVRDQISIGIYDVVADFGQARGTNTATILPNDPRIVGRYGRTILMRRNILLDPVVVAAARATWRAALAPAHHAEFDPEAGVQRTLWHEIGHYMGPDRDVKGRPLDQALEERADTFEEMKSDLVSLFSARALRASGYYDERMLRSVYASGIERVLLKSKPRGDQAYQVMELMQMNWYLDQGLLTFDASGRLRIRYQRYHEVVASLLKEVLAIQRAGDKAAAQRFIERWTVWNERHERLAETMRAAETSRFRLVRYAALGE